jgi:transcriptional regulator with XRE-family HTH domain
MVDGFGARLHELRVQLGITQQALARSAGLSVSTIARLEQGGRPEPATVTALERALGVPVGSLSVPEQEPGADGE